VNMVNTSSRAQRNAA